jgi:hypothetical protein
MKRIYYPRFGWQVQPAQGDVLSLKFEACSTPLLTGLLLPFLFRCLRPQLQCMYAPRTFHLLLQQGIDHAVSRWLHLGPECLGDDVETLGSKYWHNARNMDSDMVYLKWVSLEMLPAMAWWCEWAAESFEISSTEGLSDSVICTHVSYKVAYRRTTYPPTLDLIKSSTGVADCVAMLAIRRRSRAPSLIRSIGLSGCTGS